MPIQMNAETVEFCKKEIHDLPVKKLIRNSKSPLVLCCFIYIYLPYVTRWDYLATVFTEAITVKGLEWLGNIQVPKRASYIRVIMLELSHIASHLLWLGPFMADIGAQTPFFYIFRERELLYDLFEYIYISDWFCIFKKISAHGLFKKIASFNAVDFHRNNAFYRFNQKLICVSKSMFSKKKKLKSIFYSKHIF